MGIFFTSIFNSLVSFLLLYKYFGLFIVAMVSSIGLPIPASTALAAAGGFASQGYLNIYAVMGVTLLGSIIGDITGYWVTLKYGNKILRKISFTNRIIRSAGYRKVEEYIGDFAPSLIFFSRFLTELSPATNILAGLSEVSAKTFIIFAALGEILYTIFYGMIGFFLGSQWQNNVSFLFLAGGIILAIGIIINLVQILLFKKNTKNKEDL